MSSSKIRTGVGQSLERSHGPSPAISRGHSPACSPSRGLSPSYRRVNDEVVLAFFKNPKFQSLQPYQFSVANLEYCLKDVEKGDEEQLFRELEVHGLPQKILFRQLLKELRDAEAEKSVFQKKSLSQLHKVIIMSRPTTPGLKLRYPQTEGLSKMQTCFANPALKKSFLLVLPTGCGKTKTMAFAPFITHAKKVLILTPFISLANQVSSRFFICNVGCLVWFFMSLRVTSYTNSTRSVLEVLKDKSPRLESTRHRPLKNYLILQFVSQRIRLIYSMI